LFICPECGQSFEAAGFCTEHGSSLVDGSTDALLGTLVGSYRIAHKIGEGGMGEVYLAVQPKIGSRVAVKVLSQQCSESPTLVDRFFAEARAVNVIRHDGIVSVFDLETLPNGRPYIVMEYLEGASLAALIRTRGALPLGTLTTMLGQVLDALAAAHDQSIVHRDLKPDNVFITRGGRVKLLDFGIAKLRPDLGGVSDATRTGSLLGTPHYMSPEQARGMPVDLRSDLYAAGVILFEAATGRRPYPDATTLYELLKAHVEQMPPQPSLFRREIPPAFDEIMLRAMQKNPVHRFQSAREFAGALAAAAHALPPASFAPISSLCGAAGAAPQPSRPPAPFTPSSAYGPTLPTPPTPPILMGAAPMLPAHALPPPPRQGLSAGMIALIVLGALLLVFLSSCMACTMCVAGA
jgi:eukaryotic-like serine/threonine-protein kinase